MKEINDLNTIKMERNKTIKNMKLNLDEKSKEVIKKIKIIEDLNIKIKEFENKLKLNENNNLELETNKANLLNENKILLENLQKLEQEQKINFEGNEKKEKIIVELKISALNTDEKHFQNVSRGNIISTIIINWIFKNLGIFLGFFDE